MQILSLLLKYGNLDFSELLSELLLKLLEVSDRHIGRADTGSISLYIRVHLGSIFGTCAIARFRLLRVRKLIILSIKCSSSGKGGGTHLYKLIKVLLL